MGIWKNWIYNKQTIEDTNIWKSIIEVTNALDDYVLKELKNNRPNLVDIFENVLSKIPTILIDAEILDVRLKNYENNCLYFKAFWGRAWQQGTLRQISDKKEKTFTLGGKVPSSAGAWVMRNKKALFLDPKDKNKYNYNETFSETQRMIIIPLKIGSKVIGVLDVRSTKEAPFPKSAKHVLELMAGQMAIYYELVNAVIGSRTLQKEQTNSYRDFYHQIKTPINVAKARSWDALEEIEYHDLGNSLLGYHTKAIYGLCKKAYRVATNLRLFNDLAKGNTFRITKSNLSGTYLVKLLNEIALDNEFTINPNRKLSIEIDEKSIRQIDELRLAFDIKLLEQAIGVLLDNAVKYSYKNTVIKIFGQVNNKSFELIVRNPSILVFRFMNSLP